MTPESRKLLIAEPDENITTAVREYFSRAGWKVFITESGRQALARIRKVNPNVIILETSLRHIDGLEVCRRLKEDKKTEQIPVIFLTARDDVIDKVLGLEAGASDYLTKPFSLRELEARIKAVLRNLPVKLGSSQDAGDEPQGEFGESVAVLFDFPEEVRVPCEQYLLYFGQFLRDLGVQSTSDLSHEAGQVLFTVTPTDSHTALDKVRAALNVYLRLPSSPVSDAGDDGIAVQRLESTVLRLQGDLRLASAELQAKNMTIQAQQLIIQTQKGFLNGEIVFGSIKDVTPSTDDKEKLLGGIVALATYKEKGVEVNLAELYRKLKGVFKNKE
jgi:CheY-like chemotaxis protein